MTPEERIRFLLRVATRAEGEGNHRAARAYRRMADEARPVEPGSLLPSSGPLRGSTD
jgi:hypothetical protein